MSVTRKQADEFRSLVQKAESVLIGTHLNPDGDALGSALAVAHYLDQIGVANELVCNNLAPYNLEFLPGRERIRLGTEREHQLGVIVDLDSLDRLGRTRPSFERCEKLIVIDHHVPHSSPGDLRIVDPEVPATAVLIANLVVTLGADITADMATCLLTGIVTDTGSFRYRNTTPEALHLTAMLLEKGGDIVRVCEEVYQRKPLASVKLLGKTLDNFQISEDERLAWSTLSAQDFAEAGAMEQHTEGLVNELLFINTVQIAALIRQPQEGKVVRASIRSRENFDVTVAARKFDGGGHRNAAGCTFDVSLAEAERLLVAALRECLESSS